MVKNNYMKRVKNRIKKNALIYRFLTRMYNTYYDNYVIISKKIHRFLPVKHNRIVFESYHGKGFCDNPAAIAEELVRRKKRDLVWISIERPEFLPQGIRWVKYGSIKADFEWSTARVWVDNVRSADRPRKKKKQYYIQTWHAPFSVKCIEKDAEDKLGAFYLNAAKYDGSITDAIISNSTLLSDVYREAFWLKKEAKILNIGLPRNDKLIKYGNHEEYIANKKNELGISRNSYVVLYAPTFRDNHSVNGYISDFTDVISAFEEKTKQECLILVRLHPNVRKEHMIFHYSKKVLDVSFYDNSQDLAIISDAVISDYSSTVFDFVALNKPVFICAIDLSEYEKIRGLLQVFYELPFHNTYSKDELVERIKTYNKQEYDAEVREYFINRPIFDNGNASSLAADWIENVL